MHDTTENAFPSTTIHRQKCIHMILSSLVYEFLYIILTSHIIVNFRSAVQLKNALTVENALSEIPIDRSKFEFVLASLCIRSFDFLPASL